MEKIKLLCCLFGIFFSTAILHAQDSQWSINPYDYEYDMTVYAKLVYEGTEVKDFSNYEVAAFVDNECRGVGEVQSKDSYTWIYIRVRSNKASGENVTFKVFDKTAGKAFTLKTSQTIVFSSQGRFGMPSSPMTLDKPAYTLGDVNEDGKISVTDIIAIRQMMANDTSETFNKLAADVNEDGKISVTDIIHVRQLIADKKI